MIEGKGSVSYLCDQEAARFHLSRGFAGTPRH